VQIEVSFDDRILAFKHNIVSKNHCMTREANLLGQIERIGQVRALERGYFIAGLLHFWNGV
jgi:hypothetical protein